MYVYVSNLVYEAGASTIMEAFSREGVPVEAVELVHKGTTSRKQCSGLASVQLAADACDTQRACQLLDGKQLLGRPMIVRADRFVESQFGYDPAAAAQAAAAAAANSGSSSSSSSSNSRATSARPTPLLPTTAEGSARSSSSYQPSLAGSVH